MKKFQAFLFVFLCGLLATVWLLTLSSGKEYHFSSLDEWKHSEAFSWYIDGLPNDSHNIYLTTNVETNEIILRLETEEEISPLFEATESGKNHFFQYKISPIVKLNKDKKIFCFFADDEHYLLYKERNEKVMQYVLIRTLSDSQSECLQ